MGIFGEFAERLPRYLGDFHPLEQFANNGSLDPTVRDLLEVAGNDALSAPWVEIFASHYRDYTLTGNRTRFEDRYFQRRLKLNDLVMAEWATGSGQYLDQIVDGIFLLCEESGWQLPAHNSYMRGGARLSLPCTDRPVIDLFAAETAAILCTCRHLLGSRLDAIDPAVSARIEEEVQRRILKPYLAEQFWWMGNGSERMNNWTAWITQNVLLATFLLPTDQQLRRSVALKALSSLDAFIKDYAQDGACEEGVVYYRHAALCMFGAMLVLDQVGGGFISSLWDEAKIRNMAEFILHMHISEDSYFNFADSSAVVAPCGIREYLFGKAVGSKELASFAAADYRRDSGRLMPQEWNLWYRVQAAQGYCQAMKEQVSAMPVEDRFYPGVGLLLARDERFSLAVKAGNNGESHNHNDVGSFIIYKHGQPVLIDVGVETYNARTFSPRRYEIWTMQSAYHNLPTFGSVMQKDGEEFAARDVEVVLGIERAGLTMELAGTYPAEANIESFKRTVTLHKGRHIEIKDRYDASSLPVLSLMIAQQPVIQPDQLSLPDLATFHITGCGEPVVEEIHVEDARLRKAWPSTLYRILIPVAAPEVTIRIV